MDDFYTDEPIGWQPPDNLDDEGNPIDDDEGMHNWDYYEPTPEDEEQWQQWNFHRYEPDSPDRIQQLLDMIDRQPWQITMAKSFYEQARFMADYDDDAPIVPFNNYFPSYRGMTVDEIRSYFTIRKMLRHGQFPDVPISYIFVYIYETLMQIGIRTSEEGYEILQELLSGYSATEPKLKKYVDEWLRDYVVYYNLKDHFKEIFTEENSKDETAAILGNYKEADDRQLVEAAESVSKYRFFGGVLYHREPEKAVAGTAVALRTMLSVLEDVYNNDVATMLLGKREKQQVVMFHSAVFYTPNPVTDAEIDISPRHRYVCQGGLWTKDEYYPWGMDFPERIKLVFREADCQLRPILNVRPILKPRGYPARFRKIIADALADWDLKTRREEAQREFEKRKIRIDFSKLGGIREDAGVVQDKLLDGTDLTDGYQPTPTEPTVQQPANTEPPLTPAQKPTTPPQHPAPTEPASPQQPSVPTQPPGSIESIKSISSIKNPQKAFLRLLLTGGDWQQYLRDIHTPEGVMVEKINDLAMDDIGDIVLEDDGDGLHIIEDYRQDIEEYINNNEQQ